MKLDTIYTTPSNKPIHTGIFNLLSDTAYGRSTWGSQPGPEPQGKIYFNRNWILDMYSYTTNINIGSFK